MSLGAVLVGAVAGGAIVYALLRHWREAQREQFIRRYTLPLGLYRRVRQRRPALSDKEMQLANRALRQFFLAYLKGGFRYVSMPSQLADELWHEFILHTRDYGEFCRRAFGRMLHHTPATALGTDRKRNEGLRRCWWQACREEQLDPRRPTRLPLLFALDAKVDLPGGFRYSLAPAFATQATMGNAGSDGATTYSVGDFSDSGVDGCTDGFGDGDGCGDGGDGGGGDGGGCGGGCGGGD